MYDRTRLREVNWGSAQYVALIVFLLVFAIYHVYLTFGYQDPATSVVPRIVLGIMIAALSLELIRLYLQGMDTSDVDIDVTLAPNYVVQFAWMLVYILAMYYVGFFTVTFLFAFVYIFVNYSGTPREKLFSATASSVIIVAFLWFFFLEVIENVTLLRFGPLP